MHRRNFLKTFTAGMGLLAAGLAPAAPAFKTTLKKAVIRGLPDAAELARLKQAGFDGIESTAWKAAAAEIEAARARAAAEGLNIHSILRGWCNFNSPDAAVVAADIATVEQALETARRAGAGAILLVPCKLEGVPAPKPWEFDVAFDPETAELRRVVRGDGAPFAAYVEAHNRATKMSREAVKRLAEAAGKAGVVIALENVWNNLWVKPELFAAFVRSCGSPHVKAYLDFGNHVKYAPTEDWVRALGPLLVRCHVKDFKLNPDGHDGRWADIRDGSVRWPAVRRALEDVGYNGWLTPESNDHLGLEELNRRLNLIAAGE